MGAIASKRLFRLRHERDADEEFGQWGTYTEDVLAKIAEATKKSPLYAVRLRSMHLGVDGARALYTHLLDNRTVTALDLRENGFGARGIRYFSEVLKLTDSLLVLDVADNLLGDTGACALARNLEGNRTLKHL
eukprot:gene14481-22168_t